MVMYISGNRLLLLTCLIEGAAFATALLLSWYFDIDLFPLTDNLYRDVCIGTLGAVPPFVMFVFSFSDKARTVPLLRSIRRIMTTEVRAVFSDIRFPDIVVISAFAGFAEEMLFRGIIQVKYGIIIAGVLFGLVHFITPAYIIVTMIMGFYIGIFYYVYENLLVPIMMHFIYNLAALTYLRYCVKAEENYSEAG
jgi:membrane protease YdiL (CAAX protease family)